MKKPDREIFILRSVSVTINSLRGHLLRYVELRSEC
jgi:hypothetical protein